MEVICLESRALYELIDEVIKYTEKKNEPDWKWIDTEEAMTLLGIKSKTTLQNLRDNGEVRYSQPKKRIILYDRDSIAEYLEQNAKETF